MSRIIRLPPDWAPVDWARVDWAPVDQDSLFAQSALSDLSETEFSPAVGVFQPIMLPPGPAAVAITSGAPPTPFDLTFKGVNYSADIYQSFTTVRSTTPSTRTRSPAGSPRATPTSPPPCRTPAASGCQ